MRGRKLDSYYNKEEREEIIMSFQKKTWKDRITEFPTRRTLTKSDGSSELVTVARAEGTVSQEGDSFSAENMNNLETRIGNEFGEINKSLTASDNLKFRFTTDGEGNYGYLGADDSFIPFKSGSKAQLLWHNNNLTSTFNAQTITFNDNKYSHYVIKIRTRNDINIFPTIVLIETNKTVTDYYGGGFFYIPGNTSITRIITKTTSNSITFGNGYANNNVNNIYAIPTEIYGVNIIF
jgi:hypothetical protein